MFSAGSPLLWWDGFGWAFALTCVIEVPAYLLAFRVLGWWGPVGPLAGRTAFGLTVAVNLITHPVLWAVSHQLDGVGQLMAAELGVAVTEAGLIAVVVGRASGPGDRRTRLAWSLLTAVAVNAASVLVGALILPVLTSR
ncbi:MAG TPA: hypothetical protein VIT20_07415 [Propionibacteriaceae bacterium]